MPALVMDLRLCPPLASSLRVVRMREPLPDSPTDKMRFISKLKSKKALFCSFKQFSVNCSVIGLTQ